MASGRVVLSAACLHVSALVTHKCSCFLEIISTLHRFTRPKSTGQKAYVDMGLGGGLNRHKNFGTEVWGMI